MINNLRFILLLIFLWNHSAQALNVIQSVELRNGVNWQKIILTGDQTTKWEILSTANRTLTLLKIYNSQFANAKREELIGSLKRGHCKLNVVELRDNSILIAFKDKNANELKIRQPAMPFCLEITIPTAEMPNAAPEICYHRGVQLMQEQRYNEALQAFRKALRLRPHYAEVYFQAGIARLKLHNFHKARINFNKALRYNPELEEAKYYLRQLEAAASSRNLGKGTQSHVGLDSAKHSNMAEDSIRSAKSELRVNADSAQVLSFSQSSETDSSAPILQQIDHSKTGIKTAGESNLFNRSKLYFQLFLFLSILFVIIGSVFHWIIRKSREGNRIEEENFETNLQNYLQELQVSSSQAEEETPQNTGVEGDDSVSDVTVEKIDKPVSSSEFRYTYPKRVAPLFTKAYMGDDLQQKVEFYAGLGSSVEEIAQRFRIGKGEIQLRLGLSGKKAEMKTPELRFELAY